MQQSASFVHSVRELWEICALTLQWNVFPLKHLELILGDLVSILSSSRHVFVSHGKFLFVSSLFLIFSEFYKPHCQKSTLKCLRHIFALVFCSLKNCLQSTWEYLKRSALTRWQIREELCVMRVKFKFEPNENLLIFIFLGKFINSQF